ncbi:unnamed protein product, partial [Brachionus calyciflorus]
MPFVLNQFISNRLKSHHVVKDSIDRLKLDSKSGKDDETFANVVSSANNLV